MPQGPRERLLEAAERLTYREGASVGIAALLKEANVARRSLYEHFGGKDELLAEVLRGRAELHRLIQDELERLGHAEPAYDAERITFLIEGTLASAATRPEARPARIAADLAPLPCSARLA